jgi:5-guanidino-2-oxopentanoate decarboxylase
MKKITGGQAVVDALTFLKVDTVFGMPGQHNLAIYKALINSHLNHVSVRHEQGAGFMADGFARTSGKVGVALVISGPGLTNILTAMGEAYHEAIPMLVISTNNPTRYLDSRKGMLHELAQSNTMVKSVAKESRRIPHSDAIIPYLIEAYYLALEGRPGPVHVEIPFELLENEITLPLKEFMPQIAAMQKKPDLSEVSPYFDEAIQILKTAQNPFIMVGGGAWQAGESITQLAEQLAAPMLLTPAAKGTIEDDHPLCLSVRHHFPTVQAYLKTADVVLAFGSELGEDLYCNPFAFNGLVIRVDLEASVFERNLKGDVCLQADANFAAQELKEKMPNQSEQLEKTRQKVREVLEEASRELGTVFNYKDLSSIIQLLKEAQVSLPKDAILVTDSTKPAYLGFSEYSSHTPRSYLFPCGYGTLGMALPAAIGAKKAHPDKAVCVLAGDGGFQFTMPELGVACQENLTLPIILYNNHGLGEIRVYEEVDNFDSIIGVDYKNPEFKSLAAAYGIPHYLISKKGDLQSALTKALDLSTPSLIEVNINDDNHHS